MASILYSDGWLVAVVASSGVGFPEIFSNLCSNSQNFSWMWFNLFEDPLVSRLNKFHMLVHRVVNFALTRGGLGSLGLVIRHY